MQAEGSGSTAKQSKAKHSKAKQSKAKQSMLCERKHDRKTAVGGAWNLG
jgi:hypothetical protein